MRAPRVAALLAVAGLALAPAGVSASPARVSAFHDFGQPSPFHDRCGVDGPAVKNAEVEPSIAVNPTDPRNIVIAWQQDRFQDGAALGIMVASSRDGGRTWSAAPLPGVSKCTGGTLDRASDPWLSFGPDGTLYLATIPADLSPIVGQPQTAIAVSRSLDGGRHWSAPVLVLPQDGFYNDKESVTADPFTPGRAYLAFTKRFYATSVSYFATTRNGGRTWSAPQVTFVSPGTEGAGHLIVMPRRRTLVDVFSLVTGGGEATAAVVAMRSTDGGQTWSAPVPLSRSESNSGTDPEGENLVRAPVVPTATVGRGGVVYVAWQQVTTPDAGQVLLSESHDAGATWSEPRPLVSEPNQVLIPTLAAAPDGTLGLSFYDFRRDKPGDRALTTDIWFRHSHDAGKTWSEIHLAGPFDLRTAVDASGWMVGDYVGMAPAPRGFVNALGTSKPQARTGPNDIDYARVLLGP